MTVRPQEESPSGRVRTASGRTPGRRILGAVFQPQKMQKIRYVLPICILYYQLSYKDIVRLGGVVLGVQEYPYMG